MCRIARIRISSAAPGLDNGIIYLSSIEADVSYEKDNNHKAFSLHSCRAVTG